MKLPENWQELAKLYFIIYFIIAFTGPLLSEAIKRIYKSIYSYYKKISKEEVKINPIILFSTVLIYDIFASIFCTIKIGMPTWSLSFIPIGIFCVSIVGYETIMKTFFSLLDAFGLFIKKVMLGNLIKAKEEKNKIS